jgi:hypothetical protein
MLIRILIARAEDRREKVQGETHEQPADEEFLVHEREFCTRQAFRIGSSSMKRWAPYLAAVLGLAASIRLVRAGYVDSMDFAVYWKAAHLWISGVSPYLYTAAERGFVFKYPPWILPAFFPFGFLSQPVSQLVWAGVELLCLYYAIFRLIRLGLSAWTTIITAFLFWWIWLAHFYAGQFTIVLMACALWAIPEATTGKLATLASVFTSKVFSLVSLVGLWRKYLNWRVLAAGFAIFVVLNVIVFAVLRTHGNPVSPGDFYRQWIQAGTSGGAELGEIVIRGQMNHGFTAGLLRAFHVDPKATWIDQLVALGLAVVFSGLWFRFSRGLDSLESWVGWLGVGLIVHPLAWHHSFVLAYPLCAVALDRSLKSRDRVAIGLALFGTCCIGILIPNVIGTTLVRPLELVSIKSWGVCFAGAGLCLARRSLGPHLRA